MINSALQFTGDVLDQFLRNRFGLDESKVIMNRLIETNGSIPAANSNKVIISLINIEKETAKPFSSRGARSADGSFVDIRPSERYNLDVLISSNFDDYSETLKFLNASILFFQVNPVLEGRSFPGIPQDLSKLEFEIEKMTYHQMQSLWTAMGAKYQPSVIYKARLITIQGAQIQGFTAQVNQTSNESKQA